LIKKIKLIDMEKITQFIIEHPAMVFVGVLSLLATLLILFVFRLIDKRKNHR
jgi:hypothetical protein